MVPFSIFASVRPKKATDLLLVIDRVSAYKLIKQLLRPQWSVSCRHPVGQCPEILLSAHLGKIREASFRDCSTIG